MRAEKQPERERNADMTQLIDPFAILRTRLKIKCISPQDSVPLKVFIPVFHINFLRTWNYQILKLFFFLLPHGTLWISLQAIRRVKEFQAYLYNELTEMRWQESREGYMTRSFMICNLHQIFFGNQIKTKEMGVVCITLGGQERCIQSSSRETCWKESNSKTRPRLQNNK
jgi:hypothetical protein